MKTERLIDDNALPVVRTAIGHFFMPPSPPVTPDGVDLLLPARERLHEKEVMRTAVFCGVWSFAATGCFLPWMGGEGWMIGVRAIVCLIMWAPAWLFATQLTVAVPGALCVLLENHRILAKNESLALSTALIVLIFSIAACLLIVSPTIAFRITGGIWLCALALEGLLRVVLLARKLLASR